MIKVSSPEEMMDLGADVIKGLKVGSIVFLKGSLGVGKTVFVKGMARGIGLDERVVKSPTFTLMNIYRGEKTIYHIDLYRASVADVEILEDFLPSEDGITVVEWPEILENIVKPDMTVIMDFGEGENERKVTFVGRGG